jgi:hypothetical protein
LLAPAAVEELTQLGVSSVPVARDDWTTAVALNDWSLDLSRRDAVVVALEAREAQAPQPVVQMCGVHRRDPRR